MKRGEIMGFQSAVTWRPLSEQAVMMTLGNRMDPSVQQYVQRVKQAVERNPFPGFVEAVPSYTGLAFFYDPMNVREKMDVEGSMQDQVRIWVDQLLTSIEDDDDQQHNGRIVEIPVCYGGEFGPDLSYVADYHSCSEDQVIAHHQQGEYLIYMIGFAPGFPFVGGMAEEIATPRRDTPRERVPAGSVGIAGAQTGIYPFATPGGWQLIGQTPLVLFDETKTEPSLLRSGDRIQFVPIDEQQFKKLKEVRS
ncbi:5-oxoprolinase subunit PxpB [Geomicrobium sp. JSM 1781026]|uniref:5-oxoprolinase subunit PxpB n=1 Tax=Geomicrobium sp. JSM 1781026 TaxID=3344580 RepID=UPI0035C1B3C7